MDRSLRQSQASNHELNCIWRGFQAWDTLQDSTDDSSIAKVETVLERQEHFSQFQDMTDALPFLIAGKLLALTKTSSWTFKEEYEP